LTVVPFVLAENSFTGGAYHVEDATATAPGAYQYQLVEEQMDGTTNVLAYCTVVISSTPIIVSLRVEGQNVRLAWTGGTPPYHLYQAGGLNPSGTSSAVANAVQAPQTGSWTEVPLSDDTTNTIVLPVVDRAAFFRVSTGP
jgi:hypothetical protein